MRLCVPAELQEQVAAFAEVRGLPWVVVDAEPCDVRVIGPAGDVRRESTTDTLEAGGWIKCATAWGMAKKHGLRLDALGALLDELGIKVRQCALGCFE